MPFPFTFPYPSSSSPTTAVHTGDALLCPNCAATCTPATTPQPELEPHSPPDRSSQDTARICPSCLTRFQDLEPHERTRPETLTSFPALLEPPSAGTSPDLDGGQAKGDPQQSPPGTERRSKIRKFMGSISIPSLRGGGDAPYGDADTATRTELSTSASSTSTSPSTPSTTVVSGLD